MNRSASVASNPFRLGIDRLTVRDALIIAHGGRSVVLDDVAGARVEASSRRVGDIVDAGEPVYGINTGFGPLCTTQISADATEALQANLLRSHAVGVGDPLDPMVVRLMLLTKAHALALGHSGVRRATLDRIVAFLDRDLLPVVPSQGSVGASGDLAPLAHLFLPLIGLGQMWREGRAVAAADVLRDAELTPLRLGPKEGLALINGTQFIAAHAILGVARLARAADSADLIGAMTLEAVLGSTKPFDPRMHELRPHRGAQLVAHRLRALVEGSAIHASHATCGRVQDPYSFRCMPQVHGATRDAWRHLSEAVHVELNAVTDNPILVDDDAISGGNFHGQPLALPIDYATVAAHELGNISDRRVYRLLEGSDGVPRLLAENVGVHSGFMIVQYTAAALVSENKSLCFPASADSIPTSLGQEDHVSMGSIGAVKFLRVLTNLEAVLGVELLCAAQAFEFRRPLASSPVIEACHSLVREHVSFATEDRVFAEDIEAATAIVRSGQLVDVAASAAAGSGIDLDGGHGSWWTLEG